METRRTYMLAAGLTFGNGLLLKIESSDAGRHLYGLVLSV